MGPCFIWAENREVSLNLGSVLGLPRLEIGASGRFWVDTAMCVHNFSESSVGLG